MSPLFQLSRITCICCGRIQVRYKKKRKLILLLLLHGVAPPLHSQSFIDLFSDRSVTLLNLSFNLHWIGRKLCEQFFGLGIFSLVNDLITVIFDWKFTRWLSLSMSMIFWKRDVFIFHFWKIMDSFSVINGKKVYLNQFSEFVFLESYFLPLFSFFFWNTVYRDIHTYTQFVWRIPVNELWCVPVSSLCRQKLC